MADPITFTDEQGRFHVLRVDDESNATPDDLARAGYVHGDDPFAAFIAEPDAYLEAIGEAIDHDLGWNTPADEERGEYPELIRQAARELRALRALEQHVRSTLTDDPRLIRILGLLEAVDEARK